MFDIEQLRQRPRNAPHLIRSSLLKYIRHGFAYGLDWTHPLTGTTYEYGDVRQALEYYQKLNRENYKALWALWHTGQSRSWIAEKFCYSGSSIRRRWDKAIDSLLVFLDFPTLKPEDMIEFYESGGI